MSRYYVLDADGKRAEVIIPIAEYERLVEVSERQAETGLDEEETSVEEAEARITGFVTSADELPGPPVAELASRVTGLMRQTWEEIEAFMVDKPRNKVLATQLLLGQRARTMQADDPEQWRLHAATSLLGGMISIPPGTAAEDNRPPDTR